jgi:hypothetical protein
MLGARPLAVRLREFGESIAALSAHPEIAQECNGCFRKRVVTVAHHHMSCACDIGVNRMRGQLQELVCGVFTH